jgi:hypothetical protein
MFVLLERALNLTKCWRKLTKVVRGLLVMGGRRRAVVVLRDALMSSSVCFRRRIIVTLSYLGLRVGYAVAVIFAAALSEQPPGPSSAHHVHEFREQVPL